MENYISKFDTSIWKEAADLSCKHMSSLAMNENNKYRINNYNTFNHPNCDKFNDFSDRVLEHHMLKGIFIDKKNCLNKKPEFNNGHWEKQFGIYNPDTGSFGCEMKIEFDNNSKAKMNDKKPCIEKILNNNDNNKVLTTYFNNEYNNDITSFNI